jgi:hypothetical protein
MDLTDPEDRFKGPWFDAKTAQAYVTNKTMAGWYAWRKRHGIVARANGTVLKADLDRALAPRLARLRKRGGSVRHPNSLANLRHHGAKGEQVA